MPASSHPKGSMCVAWQVTPPAVPRRLVSQSTLVPVLCPQFLRCPLSCSPLPSAPMEWRVFLSLPPFRLSSNTHEAPLVARWVSVERPLLSTIVKSKEKRGAGVRGMEERVLSKATTDYRLSASRRAGLGSSKQDCPLKGSECKIVHWQSIGCN